jgi:hypothetical protein
MRDLLPIICSGPATRMNGPSSTTAQTKGPTVPSIRSPGGGHRPGTAETATSRRKSTCKGPDCGHPRPSRQRLSPQTYPRAQNLPYIPRHLTVREAGSRRTVRRGEIGRKGSRLLSGRYRSAWRPKRAPLPRALHLVGAIPPCEDSWAVRCVGCTMIAAPKILVGRRGASLIHICGLTASGQTPRRPAFHLPETRGPWPPDASARAPNS